MSLVQKFLFSIVIIGSVSSFVSSGVASEVNEAPAPVVGFQHGEKFVATELRGEMSLTCLGTNEVRQAHYYCTMETLDPAGRSRFIFKDPNGIVADKVVLTALHEDGSRRSKKSKFYSKTGKSKKDFNLWTRTLLQRPLLDYGNNAITYDLSYKGKTVVTNVFHVTVEKGVSRRCAYRHFVSTDLHDCTGSIYYCDRYFAESDYCQ